MSLIKALIHPVTPFQQNAPILYCEESKKCGFIDPGGDLDILLAAAKDNNLIPEKIFLTHGHADHAGAASELAKILSLKIEGPHREDLFLLPRGNHQDLLDSITNKLWPLGEEILFISGHGPVSTFGQERKDNAFVADAILNQA